MNKINNKTLTMRDLADKVAADVDISRDKALEISRSVFKSLAEIVNSGCKLELRGYFIIGSRLVEGRYIDGLGSNKAGYMPKQRKVYFKPGKLLRNMELLGESESNLKGGEQGE